MAATVQVTYYNSTGPTENNAESGGVKFNRSDDNATTSPLPIPTTTGTNFSWYKTLGLKVTVAGATTIYNRRVTVAAAASTGMAVMAKDGGAVYAQATSGNKAADAGTNGNTPTGYTALCNYAGGGVASLTWDSAGVSSASTGLNGHYVLLTLGVDNTYTGGGSTNAAVPTLNLIYDEA